MTRLESSQFNSVALSSKKTDHPCGAFSLCRSSRFLAPGTDIDHEQDCGAFAYRFVAHCFADPFNLCENRIALRFGDGSANAASCALEQQFEEFTVVTAAAVCSCGAGSPASMKSA